MLGTLAVLQTDIGQVLDDLYTSEISVTLGSEWDAGWYAKLQGPMDDHRVVQPLDIIGSTIGEVVTALAQQAVVQYPLSDFAAKYSDLVPMMRIHDVEDEVQVIDCTTSDCGCVTYRGVLPGGQGYGSYAIVCAEHNQIVP